MKLYTFHLDPLPKMIYKYDEYPVEDREEMRTAYARNDWRTLSFYGLDTDSSNTDSNNRNSPR